MRFTWIQCDFKQCEEMRSPPRPQKKASLGLVTDIGRGGGGGGGSRGMPSGGWLCSTRLLPTFNYYVQHRAGAFGSKRIRSKKGKEWENKTVFALRSERWTEVRKRSCPAPWHPHSPHTKLNPFGLLTEHLLCHMGLTQFPATCCGTCCHPRAASLPPPGRGR